MLLIEFLTETNKQVIVLDGVCDGGKLLWDLTLIKKIGYLRPVILVTGAESIRELALITRVLLAK